MVWLFTLAWDAFVLTLDIGFICPFVVIDPGDQGATVVAPEQMIDNFPPIPDAESLPLYRMGLKLACVRRLMRRVWYFSGRVLGWYLLDHCTECAQDSGLKERVSSHPNFFKRRAGVTVEYALVNDFFR